MSPPTRAGRTEEDEITPGTANGVTWFLGIGINAYKHWPKLKNAVRDVTAVKDLLVEQYGLRKENVQLLTDKEASRTNILRTIDRLADTIQAPDSLIICYAGHGHLKRRSGFWVPMEAETDATFSYIPNSRIKELIGEIPSLHTLLISDSCFSGNLLLRGQDRSGSLAADKLAALPSRYAICSGRHDEVVADGLPDSHSPFAQSILDILRTNDDSHLTAGFLKEQVVEQTGTQADQLPDGGPLRVEGHKRGQYVFRRMRNEESIWQKAKTENTINAYLHYIQEFPAGDRRRKALGAIQFLEEEENLWEISLKANQISSYLTYIDRYPDGVYTSAAWKKIRTLRSPKASPNTTSKVPKKENAKLSDELVLVDGGKFARGYDANSVHIVEVPSFYLGIYPVTFSKYDQFCQMTGRDKPRDQEWGRENRPVINVSWIDAVEYCNWLSKESSLQEAYVGLNHEIQINSNANGYRLPSAAEWEYAARGGKKSKWYQYSGGNNLEEVGWYRVNSEMKTQIVGQKKPNELGLFDLSGNVWEWCNDTWHQNYQGAPRDGSAWIENENFTKRILRGGSWISHDNYCDPNYYDTKDYEKPFNFVGFRLARSYSP